MTRKRIIFRGIVQGVGFRWRACRAASLVGATGWVRNEYDGSVTMEIQGTDDQIDSVLNVLHNARFIEITDTDITTLPPVDEERDFYER